MRSRSVLFAMVAVFGACAGGGSTTSSSATLPDVSTTQEVPPAGVSATTTSSVVAAQASGELCASVVDAEATQNGDTWTFALTVRSDDISATEFGDSWELRTLEGDVLATRVLAHEHINEQPFTRSMSGIVIPDGIKTVIGVAHHNVGGYCGETLKIQLP